jgi:hypothetical protein
LSGSGDGGISDPAKGTESRVKVKIQYYDYGDEAGESEFQLQGSKSDLSYVLSTFRDNACNKYSFTDLETNQPIRESSLWDWAKATLPPAPK